MYPEPKVCTQNPAATTPSIIHSASIFLANNPTFSLTLPSPNSRITDLNLELPARLALARGLDNLHGEKNKTSVKHSRKQQQLSELATNPVTNAIVAGQWELIP